MAKISVKSFGGISPRTPPRFLQGDQAQVAMNCPAFTGSLQPLQDVGASLLTLAKTGTPKTIYRFGHAAVSDTQYWFHWTADIDVARSAIADDASERTFFTDGTYPKATNQTLALTGGTLAYPLAWYRLGVPAPESAVVVGATGTAEANTLPETRVYTYTWVNSWGEESAPAAPSLDVTWVQGQTVSLSSFASVPSGEYNITHKRIYRSVDGTYLFVAQIAATDTTFSDTVPPDDLAEEIPSLTWAMPPAALTGIVSGANGMMAGFVGKDVYLCEPYRPFAWPTEYINTVDYDIVGLGVMDTTIAVLTKGNPYFLQGTSPESMAMVQSDIEQACVSKRSIVSFAGSVVYASPDGLVLLSSGGSKVVTSALFSRAQWQALKPSSIHAYQHDMKYVAFYDTGTATGGFIFDFASGVFIMHDIYATCGYADLQTDTLYLAFADRTLRKWEAGAAKSLTWKSKKFTFPAPMAFACAKVEAESYPATAKFYADGALVHTQTVASRNPFRLPPKTGRDWEFQLEGAREFFTVEIAQTMAELGNV